MPSRITSQPQDIEQSVDILRNNSGDLLMALAAPQGAPSKPVLLVYGNPAYPVFRRREDQEIGLPNLRGAVLTWLAEAHSIVVVEMNGAETIRSYEAEVEI